MIRGASLQAAAVCAALAFFAGLPPAEASKVVLRIRAGNPIEKTQTVQIRANLPARITTNDIINLAGLNLGYDVKRDAYFVHREVELGPRQIVLYDVELRDVWEIPPDELTALRQRAAALAARLKDGDFRATAEDLRKEVERGVDQISALQAQNSIAGGSSPIQHIRAYEANMEALGRVRKLLGRVENIALGVGIDPGSLIGAAPTEAPRKDPELPPSAYKTVILKVTAHNTSPTETRKVPIRRDLPQEIAMEDIIDAGGLEAGKEPKTGRAYLFRDQVEVGPDQTAAFEVKLRDKWNVNAPRVAGIRTNAVELLARVKAQGKFDSVAKDIEEVVAAADGIAKEQGPAELGESYVAFYRDQAARLRSLEEKLYRIESALRPIVASSRWGFNAKPPSPKTTWLIIYTIIVFLGLLSLAMTLRWMRRSKADKLQEAAAEPPSRG